MIEAVGGVDDIDKLITAMETTETEFSLGTMAYEQERIKPYFHSKKRVDPRNPTKVTYPGQLYQPIAQFQKGGEAKIICGSCPEHEAFWNQYASFDDYLTPAEARKQ